MRVRVRRHARVGVMASFETATILLVDDDDDTRDLFEFFLASRGAKVVVARSGSEATTALDGMKPDLVLLDVGLPGEDGYALVRRLRALGHTFPAIALTGHTGAANRAAALEAGFDAHLPKPVNLDTLADTISELLRTRTA
jgi:two-component system CheB/CheR fusion protein